MQKRSEPSFLQASSMGLAHSFFIGSTTFCMSIISITVYAHFQDLGPAWYGALYTGHIRSDVSFIIFRPFDICRRGPFHIFENANSLSIRASCAVNGNCMLSTPYHSLFRVGCLPLLCLERVSSFAAVCPVSDYSGQHWLHSRLASQLSSGNVNELQWIIEGWDGLAVATSCFSGNFMASYSCWWLVRWMVISETHP